MFNSLIELTFNGELGEVRVIDLSKESEKLRDYFGDDCGYQPGDILISYDWMDDELEIDQVNQFVDLMDKFFAELPGLEVNEVNGSGGGLYYGGLLLREG